MSRKRSRDDVRIVGFDLGHADTALAVVQNPRGDQVDRLRLPGASSRVHVTVTAVAEHPEKGVLLGLLAINQPDVRSRFVAFKDPSFDEREVRRPTVLFVTGVRAELEGSGQLPDDRSTHWVFGTPSGWSERVQKTYLETLRQAGLTDVEVVSESRAALVYARDSDDVESRRRTARQSGRRGASETVLVVDLGSSTADFTVVNDRKAKPVDSGVALGASLIDITIMNWFLAASPDRGAVARWVEWGDFERPRLQYACRMAKEDFFKNDHPQATTVRGQATYEPLAGSDDDFFPIRLTRATMAEVLDAPQPLLGGRSWRQAFRDEMQLAAGTIQGSPDLVILTGGASRMSFVLETAREIFGDRVVMGNEPELAIARGLALAGRISLRAGGFRKDIAALLDGGQVKTVVGNHLPALADGLGTVVADGAFERHAVPAFRQWRSGELQTLADMERTITAGVAAELDSGSGGKILPVVTTWQNELRPDLAELTAPICERWRIPPSAMELPPVSVGQEGWSPSMAVSGIVAAHAGSIAGWVAAAVAGFVAAAALVFLGATGPVGWAVGFFAAVAAGAQAEELAKDKIREANLPVAVRARFKETMLTKNASAKESELAANIAAGITEDDGAAIVAQVSAELEAELEELAREAELLIS